MPCEHTTPIDLLALAVHHRGRFVTFDAALSFDVVKGIGPHSLVIL